MRPRRLTDAQCAAAVERQRIRRANGDKVIAADLGVTRAAMRSAIRSWVQRTAKKGAP